MRSLTLDERRVILALGDVQGVSVGVIELTATQLEKSIIDATESVRLTFEVTGFHDYEGQPLGQDSKVVRPIHFVNFGTAVPTSISLYRPETKLGDPRLWIHNLRSISPESSPGDAIAIAQDGSNCVALNISRAELPTINAAIAIFEVNRSGSSTSISANAERLFEEFRVLAANGPIKSEKRGPTAIGHAIETALGITQNASKDPDKYGIEIKASRTTGKTRVNLFAQVPEWKLSACKSSTEILDRYGYIDSKGRWALRCTISSTKPNTQGLYFDFDFGNSLLHERHNGIDGPTDVATWTLDKLRKRLQRKHTETFWVKASQLALADGTYFELEGITHTADPNMVVLAEMLADGSITMDHVMKRNATGSAHEQGPLFKIWESDLPRLFTIVGNYSLT